MEDWEYDLDRILANPPEGKESRCKCCNCGEILEVDDEYWEIDGDIFCEECAFKWLDCRKNWVSEWMAYGDSED